MRKDKTYKNLEENWKKMEEGIPSMNMPGMVTQSGSNLAKANAGVPMDKVEPSYQGRDSIGIKWEGNTDYHYKIKTPFVGKSGSPVEWEVRFQYQEPTWRDLTGQHGSIGFLEPVFEMSFGISEKVEYEYKFGKVGLLIAKLLGLPQEEIVYNKISRELGEISKDDVKNLLESMTDVVNNFLSNIQSKTDKVTLHIENFSNSSLKVKYHDASIFDEYFKSKLANNSFIWSGRALREEDYRTLLSDKGLLTHIWVQFQKGK
jgi:hypothetical protein